MNDHYHHGDLREASLCVAMRMIEERGHESLAMRAVAESLGVTAMALYRHFANRTALLVAVAERAHALLYAEHQKALKRRTSPRKKLDASLRAFLDFVDQHPRLFSLMFDEEIAAVTGNALESSEAIAYQAIGALLREARPDLSEKAIRLREIALWSTLYGYASIRTRGLLKNYMVVELRDDEILDAVIDAALGGE